MKFLRLLIAAALIAAGISLATPAQAAPTAERTITHVSSASDVDRVAARPSPSRHVGYGEPPAVFPPNPIGDGLGGLLSGAGGVLSGVGGAGSGVGGLLSGAGGALGQGCGLLGALLLGCPC